MAQNLHIISRKIKRKEKRMINKRLSELNELNVTMEVLKKSALKHLVGGQRPPCTNDKTYGGTDKDSASGGDVCCCACHCDPEV